MGTFIDIIYNREAIKNITYMNYIHRGAIIILVFLLFTHRSSCKLFKKNKYTWRQ